MGGGGEASGKGGRVPTNEVDADKLWRDRITSELQQQRLWHDEYGFMVTAANNAAAASGGATQAKSTGALGAQTATLDSKELDELRAQLSKSTMRSTAQASFQTRRTVELSTKGDHGRKKYKDT